ncbi:MAG: hypothetical protein IJA35_03625 [Clostridia bacterium]|nr:hypothetical protein [Clostridia bacterium]
MKKKRRQRLTRALVDTGKGFIRSDVLGSFTGMGEDGDRPVQDAEDL